MSSVSILIQLTPTLCRRGVGRAFNITQHNNIAAAAVGRFCCQWGPRQCTAKASTLRVAAAVAGSVPAFLHAM